MLELCSGAGQIGLLAVAGSTRRLVCVDVSPVAAAYTLRNAEAAGMADRVSMREGLIAEVLEPGRAVPADHRRPAVGPPRRDLPASPRTRCWRSTAATTDWASSASACMRSSTTSTSGGVALLQLGTSEQVAAVATLLEGTDLVTGEVREYGDRGVLLRIDRASF